MAIGFGGVIIMFISPAIGIYQKEGNTGDPAIGKQQEEDGFGYRAIGKTGDDNNLVMMIC